MPEFMIKNVLKFLRDKGVVVKLLQEDNGKYGLKFIGLDSELSNLAYKYFYMYKNNDF